MKRMHHENDENITHCNAGADTPSSKVNDKQDSQNCQRSCRQKSNHRTPHPSLHPIPKTAAVQLRATPHFYSMAASFAASAGNNHEKAAANTPATRPAPNAAKALKAHCKRQA
jgi:hypothetical protein